MEAKFRSCGQKVRKPLEISVIVVGCILMITLLVVIALAYIFGVNVPGLRGKTLWDWLQLLIIPAVLAVGGYAFNLTTSRNERRANEQHAKSEREAAEKRDQTEREIAQDNQREATLQAYLDNMSDLLLEKGLRASQDHTEVRNVARARTLTVLPRLDAERKGSLIRFLSESHLLNIINLSGAVLSGADLSFVSLSGADLRGADLSNARLWSANLSGADLSNAAGVTAIGSYGETITSNWYSSLSGANLCLADLSGANLSDTSFNSASLLKANLSGANLRDACLWDADLSDAILQDAILQDAILDGANFKGANLTSANLKGATGITIEKLEQQAKSLKGATMPDGSIHP